MACNMAVCVCICLLCLKLYLSIYVFWKNLILYVFNNLFDFQLLEYHWLFCDRALNFLQSLQTFVTL